MAEILEQVRRGSWTPPRQVNATIPAALDAICRKAMALKPEDRYATPLELANDVEHWLADEPVTAYREPRGARLRRWIRKHPKRVTAAVVLLLATVFGLTIGAVLLDQSRRQLDRANLALEEQRQLAEQNYEEAEKQRKLAETNYKEAERQRQAAGEMFREARNAVDTYFTQVSEEQLLGEDRLKPLRRKLLTSALRYYEHFIEQGADVPAMRRELAKACFRASEINWVIGMNAEGQAQAARAEELYRELLAESPGDRELREELASERSSLSVAQYHAGQTKVALANVNRVIELQEPLWAEDPSNAEIGRSLANSYSWRTIQEKDAGDEEGAAADSRRAVEILEKLLSTCTPEDRDATFDALAHAYYRSPELSNCLKAIEIQRERAKSRGPEGVNLRGPLQNAGNALIVMGQPATGEPLVREAEAIQRQVVLDRPEDDGCLLYLQFPLGEVGESLFLQGRTRAARKALEEAVAIKDQLQRRNHQLGGNWLLNHTWYSYLLGRITGESGDFAKAISQCESALGEQQELRNAEYGMGKDNPLIESNSVWVDEAVSRFQFQAGKIGRDELLVQQRHILADRKALNERGLKGGNFVGQYELEVGASAAVLAGYLLDAGSAEETLAVVNEVLPAHQRSVENDKPDNRDLPDYDFRNYLFRQVWAELLVRQGEALAKTGKPADAVQAIHRAIEICEDIAKQEPCYLYDLAHHLTLAATLPGEDTQTLADRAVKSLADFIASGFDNPYKLRTDPRLEPLRGREDFQKLVGDLEAKVKQTEELR